MKILAGKVTKAQGIKGEVKVECFLDSAELLKNIKEFYLGNKTVQVENIRADGDIAYIKFKDVDDRNTAELYRGWEIFVDKESIELPEGSFLIAELLDCEVYLDDSSYIGKVVDISQFGSADVYTCEKDGERLSFPWLKDLVVQVNITISRIVLCKKRFSEVVVYQKEQNQVNEDED